MKYKKIIWTLLCLCLMWLDTTTNAWGYHSIFSFGVLIIWLIGLMILLSLPKTDYDWKLLYVKCSDKKTYQARLRKLNKRLKELQEQHLQDNNKYDIQSEIIALKKYIRKIKDNNIW